MIPLSWSEGSGKISLPMFKRKVGVHLSVALSTAFKGKEAWKGPTGP